MLFGGGGGIFQDKPLEFLSDFLLKKNKKSKNFEGNVIPTKCDPKETLGSFMKVKLHCYALASLWTWAHVAKKFINHDASFSWKALNLSFLLRTSFLGTVIKKGVSWKHEEPLQSITSTVLT